eukprot:14337520-Alexandrium_andersonii.AAC.1
MQSDQPAIPTAPWRIAVPRRGTAWRGDDRPPNALLAVAEEVRPGGGLERVLQSYLPTGQHEPDAAAR